MWSIAGLVLLSGCGDSAVEILRPPVWVAHRGNSSVAPENTLAAIRSALALDPQPSFVEVDVYASADGRLVVIHDDTLERTTDQVGAVASKKWDELSQVSAGYAEKFGSTFAQERIPLLSEVLDSVAGSGVGVMIEIKGAGIGAQVARLVESRGETDRHVVASFKDSVIRASKAAVPALATLWLVGEPTLEDPQRCKGFGAAVLGTSKDSVTPELVQACQQAGRFLWVYTVNDPMRSRELQALGADGIISDSLAFVRARSGAGTPAPLR